MRKLIILSLSVLMLLVSCTSRQKSDLNDMLVEMWGQDGVIDYQEWQTITAYLDRNKAHFPEFYKDGHLDAKVVEDYITDFFRHRRPPMSIRFIGTSAHASNFHFYIERSASMRPYDSPKGDGSFRAAVMALQNALPGKSTIDSIGEKGYTDFRQIFDQLLNRTNENDISILFTDLTYSVKDMEGVNPTKVFAEMQQMINAVFKSSVNKKSILVVRMMSSYNGPYYSYDNSVHTYNGQRPYYIIIVADNNQLIRLTQDPELRAFADMAQLHGYDNMYLFTSRHIYEPYASFLLNGPDVRGRFRPKRGMGREIRSLTNLEPDKDSCDLQLSLAVDLSHMLIDKRYLTDIRNYSIMGANVKLKAIRPIRPSDITPEEKQYIGSATHIFTLTVEDPRPNEKVKLQLVNHLPQWVTLGSTGNDLNPDSQHTFGLTYLMQGIYSSYSRLANGDPAYFEIKLNLDR